MKMMRSRSLGKTSIDESRPLKDITETLEARLRTLTANETAVDCLVCINETTPYLDAGIMVDLIRKAAVRTGKPVDFVAAGIDNNKGEYSFELFVLEKSEVESD